MSAPAIEHRFIFHANAVALAAHIRRPEDAFVSAVASACLPVTGGIGSGESAGGSFGDLLSYGPASTQVSGDYVTPEEAVKFTYGNYGQNLLPTETHARATAANFKLRNGGHTLETERLDAGLSSYSDRKSTTEFRSLSAEFTNVRIDGVLLKITTECDVFVQNPTKQKLEQSYSTSAEFRDRYNQLFQAPESVNTDRASIPEYDGIILTTVVSNIAWEGKPPSGVSIERNSIKIDNFGTLYLGELIIEEGLRRLTLVRFQLGSPFGGEGALVEVHSNGSTWPPN